MSGSQNLGMQGGQGAMGPQAGPWAGAGPLTGFKPEVPSQALFGGDIKGPMTGFALNMLGQQLGIGRQPMPMQYPVHNMGLQRPMRSAAELIGARQAADRQRLMQVNPLFRVFR
jgi:hypothetical protein